MGEWIFLDRKPELKAGLTIMTTNRRESFAESAGTREQIDNRNRVHVTATHVMLAQASKRRDF
jgi:hypothetical protein